MLGDHHFHVVVQADRSGAPQVLEGPHMLAESRLHVLRLHEPHVLATGVTQHVAEQVHAPLPVSVKSMSYVA